MWKDIAKIVLKWFRNRSNAQQANAWSKLLITTWISADIVLSQQTLTCSKSTLKTLVWKSSKLTIKTPERVFIVNLKHTLNLFLEFLLLTLNKLMFAGIVCITNLEHIQPNIQSINHVSFIDNFKQIFCCREVKMIGSHRAKNELWW